LCFEVHNGGIKEPLLLFPLFALFLCCLHPPGARLKLQLGLGYRCLQTGKDATNETHHITPVAVKGGSTTLAATQLENTHFVRCFLAHQRMQLPLRSLL
jgi:hypothetical protein